MATRRQIRALGIIREEVQLLDNKFFGEIYAKAIEDRVLHNDHTLFNFLKALERAPVDIETFLDSPEFFGSIDVTLWPEVRKSIIDINRYWWDDKQCFREIVLGGSTRSGKTERSKITICYRIYLLSCLKNPQQYYGIPSATTILFPIFAAKPQVTKREVYAPIRKYVEHMPYFQKHFAPDPLIESHMVFREKNIHVTPVGTDLDAILGSAAMGGMMDEVNFMQVILKSKKAEVSTGRSGVFDQAKEIFESVERRKRGTFPLKGPQIPVTILSSSTRYKGDFIDKRVQQIKQYEYKDVYVHIKPRWEIQPADKYSGQTFRVLVGNDILQNTKILTPDDKYPEGSYIIEVPVEYRQEFETNIDDALRDVAGISTSAISPFIKQRFKIIASFEAAKEEGLQSFLVKDNVILGVDGMPMVKRGHFCRNPSRPRYVHIDLSKNNDNCGIAMSRFDGLVEVKRGGREGQDPISEWLPKVSIELACSIKPDMQNEIDFGEIRAWVRSLKNVYGYPIKAVSYDGVYSIESIQQWRKQGMKSGHLSVDKTDVPYKQARDAVYDGRLIMYENEVLQTEWFELEYDENKEKVDHPLSGSKDVSDAVVGSYTTLLNRRSSWVAAADDDEAHRDSLRPHFDERNSDDRPD